MTIDAARALSDGIGFYDAQSLFTLSENEWRVRPATENYDFLLRYELAERRRLTGERVNSTPINVWRLTALGVEVQLLLLGKPMDTAE